MAVRRLIELALSRLADPLVAAAGRRVPAPDTVTILAFHAVTPEPREKIDVRPGTLDRILAEIAAGPAEVVPILDAVRGLASASHQLPATRTDVHESAGRGEERGLAGSEPAAPRLVLTFDDAYPDFAEHAAPRLARHGLPATLGVIASFADDGRELPFASGRGRRSMRWEELRSLRDELGELLTVANHSDLHRDVRGLSPGELADDLDGSQARFRDQLGHEPEVFVYPFGFLDDAARDLVGRTFAAGLTGRWGTNRPGADPAALCRITCFDADGAATRRLKIAGRTTSYQLARDAARAVLRR